MTKSIISMLFYSLVERERERWTNNWKKKKRESSLTSGSSSKFWESWSCWM